MSADLAASTLDRLLARGRAIQQRFDAERAGRHHLFVVCDQREVVAELRALRRQHATFLEFGSAAGVVTILADLLGYEATGVEIEVGLVAAARELAAEFGSAATFEVGSFVPVAYQDDAEHLSPDRLTPSSEAPGLEQLGLELTDFDLVFAYPWPGEEDWLFELMRRYARPDATLLTYGVRDGFTAERVDRLP